MLFRNESLKLNDKVLKEVVPSKVFFIIIKVVKKKKLNNEINFYNFKVHPCRQFSVLHEIILSHSLPSVATAICTVWVRVQVYMEFQLYKQLISRITNSLVYET